MKYIIVLFILSSSFLFSQEQINPDGYIGYLSFHLTPFFTSGEIEAKTDNDQLIGTEKISSKLGFNFEVKYPISDNFTLKGFYNYEPYQSDFTASSNYLTERFNGSKNSYGITISLYTH